MREIRLTVARQGRIAAPEGAILGRGGELAASCLAIDVSAWAEGAVGVYSIAAARPDGPTWVIAAGLTPRDGVLEAVLPDALLAAPGWARIEVRGETSGALVKSASVMLPVREALLAGDEPSGVDPLWIDQLTQAGAALGERIAAGDALLSEMRALRQQAADEAAQLAEGVEKARGWAEIAEQGIRVAGFSVDANGELIQRMPEDGANVSFAISEGGDLEVSIHDGDN